MTISHSGLLFWATLCRISAFKFDEKKNSHPHVTDKTGVQPRPQQPKLALTDFDLRSDTAARSPSFPLLKGLHLRDPCKCGDSKSFTEPGGMKGWVGLVSWHLQTLYQQGGFQYDLVITRIWLNFRTDLYKYSQIHSLASRELHRTNHWW